MVFKKNVLENQPTLNIYHGSPTSGVLLKSGTRQRVKGDVAAGKAGQLYKKDLAFFPVPTENWYPQAAQVGFHLHQETIWQFAKNSWQKCCTSCW